MRRMLMTLAALVIAAFASSASFAQQRPAGVHVAPLQYHFRQLPNGLRVYSMPDPSTANVAVQVWYDVGSKDDPTGRSGFAHLFEHMMFKATRNLTDTQYMSMMQDVGGTLNASTHADYTNYYEIIPANYLQRTLWAEAERMGSLVVDQTYFASERDVVKEELRQRVLASPYGRLFYLFNAQTSYDVHPYGRPGIGSLEDLDSATIDDVRRFHATYYRPDNAVMVVAGNFDQAQFDRWVDQYFGGIERPSRPIPRVTAVEPDRAAARELTTYAPNVPLPAAMVSYPGPVATDPDMAAFVVMDAVLTTGASSRLYHALVYDQQLATAAFSQYEPRQAASAYQLYVIMNQGKDINEGVTSLNAELARLRDAPVTAEELERAKSLYVTGVLQARETAEGRSAELTNSVISFGNPDATSNLLNAVQAVTAADVQRAARRFLNDSRRVTLRYLDESARPSPNAGDRIVTASTLQTRDLTIPASEVPNNTLAPEGQRVQPPAAAAAISPRIARTSERRLSNGMRVIVASVRDLPLTAATLMINSGEIQDPADRSGVADLVGALVTQGTSTMSATEIAARTESLGASLSATGALENSYVQLLTRSDHANEAFPIFADVARNPTFAAEELERQRQQTLNGISLSMSQPGSIAGRTVARIMYPQGPYGAINTPRSTNAITRDDVVNYHRTYWRPDNATLVIVGDVSASEGFALAQRNFGNWARPRTALPARPDGAGPVHAQPRTVVVDLPQTGQAAVTFGARGVPRTDPAYMPTYLAATVMGGGFTARLNQEIRVRRGLSYGATASMGTSLYPAFLTANSQTRNDAATQVADLIAAEFDRMGREPVPAIELDARKASVIGGFGRAVETRFGLSSQIATYAFFGMPLNRINSYVAEVNAVTPAQVQAAARTTLAPANTDIVIVGDANLFWDALHAARPTAERIPVAQLNLDSPTLH